MVILSCKTLGEIICIKRPETSLFLEIKMIYCFYRKASAWSKGRKDGSPSPHNSCLIIIMRCSGRKFLVWLCEETSNNKHCWTPVNLNILHHNRTQKCCNTLCKNITNFLFCVLWTYLVTPIKNNNPNL